MQSMAVATVNDDFVYDRCPKRTDVMLVNTRTGEEHPARCQRFNCPHCGWARFREREHQIAMSRPTMHIVLTLVTTMWSAVQTGVKAVVRHLRRAQPLQLTYVVEANTNPTLHHIHLLARGDEPVQEWDLRDVAVGQDLGSYVSVTTLETPLHQANAAHYVLKDVLETPHKTGASGRAIDAHLARNGGKPENHSRDFFQPPLGTKKAPRTYPSDWIVVNC